MSIGGITMSGALSTAVQAIRASGDRLDRAAERIANHEGDLASNLVEMKSAELAAAFGAAVFKVAMDTQRHALDLLA
jgi:hypothetical protein